MIKMPGAAISSSLYHNDIQPIYTKTSGTVLQIVSSGTISEATIVTSKKKDKQERA